MIIFQSSSATGGALITTVNFCENGKFAVCGTYDGRCVFFDTEVRTLMLHLMMQVFLNLLWSQHLKYHTQIHVRSSRGRNTKGHKVTGIEPLPGEHKILVNSVQTSKYYLHYDITTFPGDVKWFSSSVIWFKRFIVSMQIQRSRQYEQSN